MTVAPVTQTGCHERRVLAGARGTRRILASRRAAIRGRGPVAGYVRGNGTRAGEGTGAMIQARHLTKKYGGKVAVDDLSFEVRPGLVTGFLGPNGAGKSTTMRLMLGLDNGAGMTLFDGEPYRKLRHPMHEVGTLLEVKAFHPTRRARNHLRMLAASHGISRRRVDEVLDWVGLTSVAKKRPKGYSFGMAQRLGLAAA